MNFTQILSSALVLLSIIDIVGSVPIIMDLRAKGREVNAWKATLYSAIVMVGFYYGGYWILEIFNCNIQSFAAAGGFLMFLMALEMILDVEIFKNNAPSGGATIVPDTEVAGRGRHLLPAQVLWHHLACHVGENDEREPL